MNLKFSIVLLIIVGAVILIACKKKENPTEPIVQPIAPTPVPASMQDLKNFMALNLFNAKQTFVINEDTGQTITGSSGTVINFSPNSFVNQNGAAVTGNITIELVEVFSKKDMILMNAATMGRQFNGLLKPLVSGGELKITATQNGQVLKLAPGMNYQATVPALGGVDPNMTLFYGEYNPDTLVFAQVDSAQFFGQGGQYTFWADSINWVNLDYFWYNQSPQPQTIVQASPPAGFNDSNMLVFISFDGLMTIANIYGYSGGNFTTGPNYTLSVGMPVHFIAIAFIGGNPHVSIVQTTLSTNHIQVIPALTQMTNSQLISALSALP